MKIGILGAGAWGTALALTVSYSGCDVVLWSYDGETKDFGIDLGDNITVTKELKDMAHMDAWLIVTPSAFFRELLRNSRDFYKNQPIIICTKGIEKETYNLMSEVLTQELPECKNYGVLSGPQFAAEVANKMPTGSTLAGNAVIQELGKQVFKHLYIEESDDIVGVEICGFGKNAVAIISGYLSETVRGENERAMLFTKCWCEVMEYGVKKGARSDTFLRLCGLGDLFLSATSVTSRNYSAGVAIAKNQELCGTVEGIYALRGLIHLAGDAEINLPTCSLFKSKMKI